MIFRFHNFSDYTVYLGNASIGVGMTEPPNFRGISLNQFLYLNLSSVRDSNASISWYPSGTTTSPYTTWI